MLINKIELFIKSLKKQQKQTNKTCYVHKTENNLKKKKIVPTKSGTIIQFYLYIKWSLILWPDIQQKFIFKQAKSAFKKIEFSLIFVKSQLNKISEMKKAVIKIRIAKIRKKNFNRHWHYFTKWPIIGGLILRNILFINWSLTFWTIFHTIWSKRNK